MLATDVSAPEIAAKLCGREVLMRFDHNQMRQSELYWQYSTGGVLGYYGIVDQAANRTYCGLGAICYGAVAAAAIEQGKQPISMAQFDRMADYRALRPLAGQMIDCVIRSLPGPEGGEKNADGLRGAQTATPGTPSSQPGCEQA